VTEGAQTISINDGLEDDGELDDIVMKLASAKIKVPSKKAEIRSAIADKFSRRGLKSPLPWSSSAVQPQRCRAHQAKESAEPINYASPLGTPRSNGSPTSLSTSASAIRPPDVEQVPSRTSSTSVLDGDSVSCHCSPG